jgi:hypothetical protein
MEGDSLSQLAGGSSSPLLDLKNMAAKPHLISMSADSLGQLILGGSHSPSALPNKGGSSSPLLDVKNIAAEPHLISVSRA